MAWVPVCPEVKAGLGVPRDAMRLVGESHAPHLITINTRMDHNDAMNRFAQQRVWELEALGLRGFVFKSGSPSCGIGGVSLFSTEGKEQRDGVGLFAQAFREHFPLMPAEEESRLHDPEAQKNFLKRVRAYTMSRNNL